MMKACLGSALGGRAPFAFTPLPEPHVVGPCSEGIQVPSMLLPYSRHNPLFTYSWRVILGSPTM